MGSRFAVDTRGSIIVVYSMRTLLQSLQKWVVCKYRRVHTMLKSWSTGNRMVLEHSFFVCFSFVCSIIKDIAHSIPKRYQ